MKKFEIVLFFRIFNVDTIFQQFHCSKIRGNNKPAQSYQGRM